MATITLKEIAERLADGDEKIVAAQEVANTKLTSIDKGIQKFLKAQADKKLDDLENERERRKSSTSIGAAVAGSGASGAGAGAAGAGLFKTLSDLAGKGLLVGAVIGTSLVALKTMNVAANALKNVFDDRLKTTRGLQRLEAEELKQKEAAKAKQAKAAAAQAEADAKKAQAEADARKKAAAEQQKEIERLKKRGEAVELEKLEKLDAEVKANKAAVAEVERLKKLAETKKAEEKAAKALAAEANVIKKTQNTSAQKLALADAKAASVATDPAKAARPRYPAGTVIDGKKVGGQFMPDSAIKTMPTTTPSTALKGATDTAKAVTATPPSSSLRAAKDTAASVAKGTVRGAARVAAVAAPIIAAMDAGTGAGQAAEEARALNREATRGEVGGKTVGAVAGGFAGIIDLVPALVNYINKKAGGEGDLIRQTTIGADVANAVSKGITEGYAKQGIGTQQIEKGTADTLIRTKERIDKFWEDVGSFSMEKATSNYKNMYAGQQQQSSLADAEAAVFAKRGQNNLGSVVAAPQTNVTDNSRKTTIINQQESQPSTMDNWSGFSVMP